MQDNEKELILPCYSVPDLEKAGRNWRKEVKVSSKIKANKQTNKQTKKKPMSYLVVTD